jgi:phosphate transport system substrate-binding protein
MKNWKFFLVGCILFAACNTQATKDQKGNTADSNTIGISIDESFQPIMAEQIKVFESSYPDTKVLAEYKPEAECLKDLDRVSTRMVIISRELSKIETAHFNTTIAFKPEFARLAEDAVAVIINKNNPDSTYSVNDLKQILIGAGNKKINVAIDGNTATSTVRYLRDSLLNGGNFGKNVTGAKNSEDLINYIATTPGAIGFVGISWLTNPQTKQQEQLVSTVKMALIECKNCDKDVFARPSQQTITFNQYPLVRGLYYVLKENYAGLGSRFVQFLSTERGQLIFRRALLVPTRMNFDRRRTNINESE